MIVDSFSGEEGYFLAHVRSPRTQASCPKCGKATARIHQYHRRTVQHAPYLGRKVFLRVRLRRFLCRNCAAPFTEHIPGIDRKRSTKASREALMTRLASQSVNAAARDGGVSPATAQRAAVSRHEAHSIDWEAQGSSFSLGLDGHSFRGHDMAGTVTNLSENRLLDILPNDRKATIQALLDDIPPSAASRIAEVCIDMDPGKRNAIRASLPDASVVADRYHVIAEANRVIDLVRRVLADERRHRGVRSSLRKNREDLEPEEREKLARLFSDLKPFPSLEIAWNAKEKLRDMYRCGTKEEAEHKLRLILLYLEGTDSEYLQGLHKTLTRWREEILNFFDRRTTNGYTEGVHTKIKMLKRISYGFRNRRNYIAKMMLAFIPLLCV